MAKTPREKVNTKLQADILGSTPVMTVQQRQALEKQKKDEEKALRKKMRAEARARNRDENKQLTYIVMAMIAVVVVAAVVLVFTQTAGYGLEAKEDMTYFLDNALIPDMPEEGLGAVINEVYYTRNGGLYISMNFSNAEPTAQHPTSINLKLMNGNDEVIAQGTVTEIEEDFYIIQQGYNSYEFFIPARSVKIADDPLSEIRYEIEIQAEEYTK